MQTIQSYLLRTTADINNARKELSDDKCSNFCTKAYKWLASMKRGTRLDLTKYSGDKLKWTVWACCWWMYDPLSKGEYTFSNDYRYFIHE